MNTIVTKETWSSDPDNAPLASDFNRIESNTRKVEENRQEETDARIADVNAEASRAIAAEGVLQTNIDAVNADLGGLDFVNGNAGAYGSKTIAQNERWIPPAGTYIFVVYSVGGIWGQIYSGSDWNGFSNNTGIMQMTVDGVNFSFVGLNVSVPGNIFYRKLA